MVGTITDGDLAIIQTVADQTRLITDLYRGVPVASGWFKTSSATSSQFFAANPGRNMAIIVNTDANDLWIRYGTVAASNASGGWTYKIASGVTWEMPGSKPFLGPIQGIWTAAGAGVAEITEY